jgi:hypothetical protein
LRGVVDFDADKWAEVGGGLRGVKGHDDAGSVGLGRLAVPLREDGLEKCVGIGEGYAEHRNFVGDVAH